MIADRAKGGGLSWRIVNCSSFFWRVWFFSCLFKAVRTNGDVKVDELTEWSVGELRRECRFLSFPFFGAGACFLSCFFSFSCSDRRTSVRLLQAKITTNGRSHDHTQHSQTYQDHDLLLHGSTLRITRRMVGWQKWVAAVAAAAAAPVSWEKKKKRTRKRCTTHTHTHTHTQKSNEERTGRRHGKRREEKRNSVGTLTKMDAVPWKRCNNENRKEASERKETASKTKRRKSPKSAKHGPLWTD